MGRVNLDLGTGKIGKRGRLVYRGNVGKGEEGFQHERGVREFEMWGRNWEFREVRDGELHVGGGKGGELRKMVWDRGKSGNLERWGERRFEDGFWGLGEWGTLEVEGNGMGGRRRAEVEGEGGERGGDYHG